MNRYKVCNKTKLVTIDGQLSILRCDYHRNHDEGHYDAIKKLAWDSEPS